MYNKIFKKGIICRFPPPPESAPHLKTTANPSHKNQSITLAIPRNTLSLALVLYVFFFVLNAMFPTQSDDFGITSVNINAAIHSYMHWNGRFGELLRVWFGSPLAHTPYFAFVNAFFGVGFLYLLFVLLFGRFPIPNLADCATIAFMLFLFMAFRAFGAMFFWTTGAMNYLWAYSFMLLYLLPYRIFWQNPTAKSRFSLPKALGMLIYGIIAGWSYETGIVIIVFQFALLAYGLWRGVRLPLWYYAGIVGFVAGWIVLFVSPGSKERMVNHFQESGAYMSPKDFLAMSFSGQFERWQKVFSPRNLYATQIIAFIVLIWVYSSYACKTYTLKIPYIALGICVVALLDIYSKTLGFLIAPLILCFSIYTAYSFYKNQEKEKAFYAFVIACCVFAYFLSIVATLQYMYLPRRAEMHYAIFDIVLLVFVGKFLKDTFLQRAQERFQKLLIIVCICYGAYVLMACADMRLKWERMLASIAAQKALGVTELIVEAQTFKSYYKHYCDWGNPGEDPEKWPNTTYARVFGVEKFIAK